MTRFTFTADAVKIDGRSYPATYAGRPSAFRVIFADGCMDITPSHPQFAEAALAFGIQRSRNAAKLADVQLPDEITAAVEEEQAQAAAVAEQAQHIEAAKLSSPVVALTVPRGHRTAEDDAFALAELSALGVKTDIPTQLEGCELPEIASGAGWRIVLDSNLQRTRLIFDSTPTAAALELVEAARFFWSPNTRSYHKKLTQKARRAALVLASELQALAV